MLASSREPRGNINTHGRAMALPYKPQPMPEAANPPPILIPNSSFLIFNFPLLHNRHAGAGGQAGGPVARAAQHAEPLAQMVGAGAVDKGDAAVLHAQVDGVRAGVDIIDGVAVQRDVLFGLAVLQQRGRAGGAGPARGGPPPGEQRRRDEIGRASCRERV